MKIKFIDAGVLHEDMEVDIYEIKEGFHKGKHVFSIDDPGFLVLDKAKMKMLLHYLKEYCDNMGDSE